MWDEMKSHYATKEANDSGPHAALRHVTTSDSTPPPSGFGQIRE